MNILSVILGAGIVGLFWLARSGGTKKEQPVNSFVPTPTNDWPPPPAPTTSIPKGYVWVWLEPGATYLAGFSRPFFVSDSMIGSAIAEHGGTLTGISSREQNAPIELAKTDPLYGDEWDEWLSAQYTSAQKGWISMKRYWKWLIVRRLKQT
jgi:hypothetical protein